MEPYTDATNQNAYSEITLCLQCVGSVLNGNSAYYWAVLYFYNVLHLLMSHEQPSLQWRLL